MNKFSLFALFHNRKQRGNKKLKRSTLMDMRREIGQGITGTGP